MKLRRDHTWLSRLTGLYMHTSIHWDIGRVGMNINDTLCLWQQKGYPKQQSSKKSLHTHTHIHTHPHTQKKKGKRNGDVKEHSQRRKWTKFNGTRPAKLVSEDKIYKLICCKRTKKAAEVLWIVWSSKFKYYTIYGLKTKAQNTRRFSNHESRLLSWLHTFAIIVIFNRFENTSKYVDTLTLFSKNLNQRSLTPRWPLTPCLLRSHVWLYPRIIVSKSHDDTSMYVDTVINFANYHIHTYTYYVHTTYYVQNEWSHSLLLNSVQARQKVWRKKQISFKNLMSFKLI